MCGIHPDEEIGRGAEHFNIEQFGAKYPIQLTVTQKAKFSMKISMPARQIFTLKDLMYTLALPKTQ